MKKLVALLLLAGAFSASLLAQAVSVGMSESDLVKSKGMPQTKAQMGKKSIYRWPDAEVILINGKVESFKLRDVVAERMAANEAKRAAQEREYTERMRKADAAAEARSKVLDSREATTYSRLEANATNRATEERMRRAASLQQQIRSVEQQLSDDDKRSSFKGTPPMSSEARALLNFRLDSMRSELATLR
jgi:hypothetical protein